MDLIDTLTWLVSRTPFIWHWLGCRVVYILTGSLVQQIQLTFLPGLIFYLTIPPTPLSGV